MNKKQIVYLRTQDLIPYENNPRKNDRAVPYVIESIQRFGFKVPIVVDGNNVIVNGHTRHKAALKMGLAEVPCIVADDLTEEQIKAFRLADNKTSEFAIWDTDKLLEELEGLSELDFDIQAIGFEPLSVDIDEFFQEQPPAPVQQTNQQTQQPAAAPAPVQSGTQIVDNGEHPQRFIKCPHCGEMIEVG